MGQHEDLILEEIAEQRYLGLHPDPELCLCGGTGWWCTNYDTWETCSLHFAGQPHPEEDLEP